jgi:hypothetical protein
MAYTKMDWKARKGVNLNKFLKLNETAATVILDNAPDAITVPGTPFSEENMNHIEQGVYDAHELVAAETENRQAADENLKQQILALTPEGQEGILIELEAIRQRLEDFGNIENIDVANNEGQLGLVTGAEDLEDGSNDGMIAVQSDGKMRLIGFERLGQGVVGELHELASDLSEWEMAKFRYLPLDYRIINIALYQELCDLMWVGPFANGTDYFWYKCDVDGTRNANGLYMRVADWRGLFSRAAGANAVFKAANDTPYDGNAIGNFTGDASRRIVAGFDSECSIRLSRYATPTGAFVKSTTAMWGMAFSDSTTSYGILGIDSGLVVPTAPENRPASISALICISY